MPAPRNPNQIREQPGPRPSPSQLADTYPNGRRCTEPGCITILCRFNGGPWCYLHAQRHEAELLRDEERRQEREAHRARVASFSKAQAAKVAA